MDTDTTTTPVDIGPADILVARCKVVSDDERRRTVKIDESQHSPHSPHAEPTADARRAEHAKRSSSAKCVLRRRVVARTTPHTFTRTTEINTHQHTTTIVGM